MIKTNFNRFAFLLLASLILPAPQKALAQEEEDSQAVLDAKTHFKKGVEYFNVENWEKALREFQKAFNSKPHWKIRYNIGLCYLKLEFWAQAMTEMTLMLEEGGKNVPGSQAKKVANMIDSLEDKVGKLTLEGEMENVDVYVDGKPIIGLALGGVLFLNPGEHRVEVRVGTSIALSEDVVLTGGQDKVLEVKIPEEAMLSVKEEYEEEEMEIEEDMEPEDTGPEKKRGNRVFIITGSVLAAVAGAALIGGTAAGVNAIVEKGKMDDAYDAYPIREDDWNVTKNKIDKHYDKAKTSALASTVLLSIGGGIAAASLVTFLIPVIKKEKEKTASDLSQGLRIHPAPAGLLVSGSF